MHFPNLNSSNKFTEKQSYFSIKLLNFQLGLPNSKHLTSNRYTYTHTRTHIYIFREREETQLFAGPVPVIHAMSV